MSDRWDDDRAGRGGEGERAPDRPVPPRRVWPDDDEPELLFSRPETGDDATSPSTEPSEPPRAAEEPPARPVTETPRTRHPTGTARSQRIAAVSPPVGPEPSTPATDADEERAPRWADGGPAPEERPSIPPLFPSEPTPMRPAAGDATGSSPTPLSRSRPDRPTADPDAGGPSTPTLPGTAPPSRPLAGERVPLTAVPSQPGGAGATVRRPARILALANQKGGVGKTTSVINLGAALAEFGNRVLLVDMDPQGSLGLGLGADPHNLERTIYNLLMQDGTTPDEVVVTTTQERLHLLPANIDLAAAEVLLVQEVAREQSLRRVLERLRYRYDFILIDCPPSLGLLTINGLTAADGVVVPLECEYFALRGMSLLMNTIQKVRERLNPELELRGILPTMLDARTLHAREVLERVHQAFGDVVFKTTISKTIRFAEAPVAGEPILSYAPENKGAEAYRDLAREVLSRESAG